MKPTLTEIQALNLKGANVAEKLAPLTAVIGENAGGKTTIAQAITIALLGHVPALGKQPGKTAQLMTSGARMLDILATLSDGRKINRRLDVGRSVKATLDGPDFSEEINPVQIDFGRFVAAKATERQRILEGLMGATAGEAIAEVAREQITRTGSDIVIAREADGSLADGWLQQLEIDAREAAKLIRQDIDTASKTILQLQADERPEAFDVEEWELTKEQLEQALEELGAAREAFDAVSERQQNAPDRPEGERISTFDIEAAEAELDSAREQLERAVDSWNAWNEANREALALTAPFDGVEPVESAVELPSADELATLRARAAQQLADARQSTALAENDKKRADADFDAAQKRADELESADCCPTCGIAGGPFREQVRKLADAELTAAGEAVEAALDRVAAARAGEIVAAQALEEIEAGARAQRQHAAFLATVAADKLLAAVSQPEKKIVEHREEVERLESRVRRMRQGAAEWMAWETAAIPTEAEAEAARNRWLKARGTVEGLEECSRRLHDRKVALDQWLAGQKRIADLNQMVEQWTARMTEAKALADWAKAESREQASEALKPLLDVCNVITAGLTAGPLAIAGTDIGIQVGDVFRPLEVLSGSEAAAVAAAIQVAIAGKSPVPIVMIDELSRFSETRKQIFIQNLSEAIRADLIGQAVVFDHNPKTGVDIALAGGLLIEIAG